MGASKLFVWGEGVWRELDVSSGVVSGWRRRARFVFVRRGRLVVARRRHVLRALRALVAGQPGAAADGPRLPHRSKSAVLSSKHKHRREPAPASAPAPAPAPPPAPCSHHHCCTHYNGCNNNTRLLFGEVSAAPLAQRMREAATQYSQQAPPPPGPAPLAPRAPRAHSSGDEFVNTAVRHHASTVTSLLSARKPGPKSKRVQPRDMSPPADTRTAAGTSERGAGGGAGGAAGGGAGRAGVCKELVIPESDVAALRSFVCRTRASALQRFDADDEYKRALFYAINPLVEIEYCATLEQLQRSSFAARLGLAPRSAVDSVRTSPSRPATLRPRAVQSCVQRTSSSSMDTDKENKEDKHTPANSRERYERSVKNKAKPTAPPREHTRSTRLRESARDNREGPPAGASAPAPGPGDQQPAPKATGPRPNATTTAHVISNRATARSAKEYSNLEDHAIVAWVSAGSRASLVNGNSIWRDLQEQYHRLTGCSRSWHSLRNRYLRYILPALGALRLPPSEESRLRAAAATGAIKKRRPAGGTGEAGGAAARQRRNSIFNKEVAVRGASSRRPPPPPPPPHSPPPPPPPAPPVAAGAATSSPDDDDDDDTFKPSNVKRHKGASSSVRRSLRGAAQQTAPTTAGVKSPSLLSSRSPRYSEVTRRFAARHRRTADTSSSASSPARAGSPPASPPVSPPTSRSRRLFNPNINVS